MLYHDAYLFIFMSFSEKHIRVPLHIKEIALFGGHMLQFDGKLHTNIIGTLTLLTIIEFDVYKWASVIQ